jgi:2-C-methyl-D-erythritol 4-phosphate cytidylyltransferase
LFIYGLSASGGFIRVRDAVSRGEEVALMKQRIVAIIPAAGLGIRMGSKKPKQFLKVNGIPLLALTLRAFQESGVIDRVIVVVPGEEIEACQRDIVLRYGFDKVENIVAGGVRRQDSVRLGIEAAGSDVDLVVIHDGVRPLVDRALVERVISAARICGAAAAGMLARETVKETDSRGEVIRTLDRSNIWLVQTPQVFTYELIRDAHERAWQEAWSEATDDAGLVERLGVKVKMVTGSETNIKVTTPMDLDVIRFMMGKEGDPFTDREDRNRL